MEVFQVKLPNISRFLLHECTNLLLLVDIITVNDLIFVLR